MPRSGEKPLLMALVLMAAVIVASAGVAFSDIRTLAILRDAAIASHQILQAICNLLNNAAKFTHTGGMIVLSAWQDGAHWVVSVRDDGEGIPLHVLGHIFKMFAQNDALATPRGGLGVGLALVKHIAELHGGTLAASSPGPGQGAEFQLRLPVNGA